MVEREIRSSLRKLKKSRGMNAKHSELRIIFLAIAFVFSAPIGYFVADRFCEGLKPTGIRRWCVARRDPNRDMFKAGVSLCFGMLGVALAGFDLLPKGDDAKTREGPPC